VKLEYKVVLYSVLLFPGAGYFLLRARWMGWLCVGLTLVCLGFVMFEANHKSKIIVEQIKRGELTPTVAVIARAIKNTPSPLAFWQQWLVYGSLVGIWAIAILDGYHRAKKRPLSRYAATVSNRE
jgi:phosphatidylglycerophosphate synthase